MREWKWTAEDEKALFRLEHSRSVLDGDTLRVTGLLRAALEELQRLGTEIAESRRMHAEALRELDARSSAVFATPPTPAPVAAEDARCPSCTGQPWKPHAWFCPRWMSARGVSNPEPEPTPAPVVAATDWCKPCGNIKRVYVDGEWRVCPDCAPEPAAEPTDTGSRESVRALAECIHAGLLDQRSRQHYDALTITEMIEAQISADLSAQRQADTELLDFLQQTCSEVGCNFNSPDDWTCILRGPEGEELGAYHGGHLRYAVRAALAARAALNAQAKR